MKDIENWRKAIEGKSFTIMISEMSSAIYDS